MTVEEVNEAVRQLRECGYSDNDILNSFCGMYFDDKITLTELEGLVAVLGYHLVDEFYSLPKKVLKQLWRQER